MSEDSCLARKSMFDSNENMCTWKDPADLPTSTDDGQHYPCTFVEPDLSWKVDVMLWMGWYRLD